MKNFIIILIAVLLVPLSSWAATSIPFTISTSEAVNVTGTPRIAVDVGGTTRYATYTSGTGTSSLTFTYTMVAGDVDLDGVTLTSPMQLNGGTIKDLRGNDATLTYAVPNTSNVKVNYPSLGMDFVVDADGRYTLNGTVYNDLPSFLTATGGTFTRASIGTYFDSSGVMQTAASGTPRFDYDPVTHAAKGILIEESRTNLLLRSGEFDNGAWGKSNTVVIANIITAPDGTQSADSYIPNNSGMSGVYQSPSPTNGNIYVFSVYIKSAGFNFIAITFAYAGYSPSGATFYNLSSGTVLSGTGTISPVGNGWFKCSVVGTATTVENDPNVYIFLTDSSGVQVAGDGVSGFYVWGAQVEQGAFPTSYIPTTTATVTRTRDIFQMPAGAWFSGVNGTQTAEYLASNTFGRVPRIVGYDGSGTMISLTGADNQNWYDGTVLGTANTISNISLNKVASSYDSTNKYTVLNGGTVVSAAKNLTFPISTATQFYFGSEGGTGNILNGWISKTKYYPLRVTDTQLQLLTQ